MVGTHISIAILCGGLSTRFGTDKSTYKIFNEPLYMVVYKKFEGCTPDIFLQADRRREYARGVAVKYDRIAGKGALGGIWSAILNATYEKVFVIGCDMPFVDKTLFDLLSKHAAKYELVVPRWTAGHYEPLCAIYSKKTEPEIKEMLLKNDLKITNLYSRKNLKLKTINIDALIKKGKISANCFANINSYEDLKKYGFCADKRYFK